LCCTRQYDERGIQKEETDVLVTRSFLEEVTKLSK